jgi:hypothetical protein
VFAVRFSGCIGMSVGSASKRRGRDVAERVVLLVVQLSALDAVTAGQCAHVAGGHHFVAGVAIDISMCWLRCVSDVTFPRQRRRTLIFMTALAIISALGAALCVGYHLGRRAGSKPSTWKKRTSRVALGRLAINLLVLMTARRIRHSFQAGRVFCDAGGIWELRFINPLGLLRGSVARLRSY